MEIEVRKTGREDREGPWKVAIAGYPGAGKTLLASTVEPGENLFIWFPDSPIKSVASRQLPHVRLANEMNPDGTVRSTVQDQLQLLIGSLHMQLAEGNCKYKAITVDTGDQLFQQMASARRIKNRGEFGPGDWVWLADAYRSVMQSLIDLPIHVIVLFHVSASQDGQDGFMVRELALQGSSKPDAPGWFDVVAALDTFETDDADGDTQTQRVLLTHSSRLYPWVKDHSGNMPPRFPISAGFWGDWDRLYSLFVSDPDSEFKEGESVETFGGMPVPTTKSGAAVPSPSDLQVKKASRMSEGANKSPDDSVAPFPEESLTESPKPVADAEPIPSLQTEVLPLEEDDGEPQASEPTIEAAIATLEEGGIAVVQTCAVCEAPVEDEDLREISHLRFKKYLCRDHFSAALKEGRK